MKVSRLSIRELLNLNILWFSLNFQYAALLPIVIPTQILLFVDPSQVGSAEQATFFGLWDASATLPAIIAPLLGSLIINVANAYGQTDLGYRLVFLVVSAVCVLFVREGRGKGNIRAAMTRK